MVGLCVVGRLEYEYIGDYVDGVAADYAYDVDVVRLLHACIR